ncbi:MAG: nicotinate (nicotinamide) nucleotide adenylyltransferase [Bacteroidota bacterium]
MRKIGIYGGTFNPPHIGHLITAECVKESLGLDEIFFIPSFISPHKQEGEEFSAVHRFEMMQRAIEGNEYFNVSDFEILRRETSYSVTTLEHFKKEFPQDELYLIIGMDNYLTFHLWKEPERIMEIALLAVMNRPNYPRKVNVVIGTKKTVFVDVPDIDVSSSDIRFRVKSGKSIRYLVPFSVERYIREHNLYK